MSFLNSVLKSITKGEDSTSSPASRPSPVARPSSQSTATAGVKRKAESDLQRPNEKSQKTADGRLNRVIKALPQRSTLGGSADSSSKTAVISKPTGHTSSNGTRVEKSSVAKPSVPEQRYGGTSKLASTSNSTPLKSAVSTEQRKPITATKPNAPAQPPPASNVKPQAQPKKGSFKDLMARAKTAQTVAVGKITHKAAEKISRRDRLALAKGKPVRGKEAPPAAPAKPGAPNKATAGRGGKPLKSSPPSNPKYQGTSKPKPTAKPAYSGTSKPKTQSSYGGTSRPNAAPKAQNDSKAPRKADRNEYLGTDEEDEGEYGYDEDSDAHYYENSDDFSDMDAGFDEIGDEEEEAERQAKRDDIKEQKLLEKLAKEKQERKKGRF